MKYFEVKKEELRGSLMSGEIYSDGDNDKWVRVE